MHAKYLVPISNGSKVIAKVEVDNKQTNERTNRQTDRQTDRQDKNNMSPIIRSGGIKFFCRKLDFGMEKKPYSSYNLVYHFCAFGLSLWPSGLRKKFLGKGNPPRPMLPAMGPHFGGSCRKTTTLIQNHEHSMYTKCHVNPSSGFGEDAENVNSLRRTTDGRMDDGQHAITIVHSCELKTPTPLPTSLVVFGFSLYAKEDHPPRTNITQLRSTLSRTGRRTTLIQNHEYFISTKFCQNPPSGSEDGVKNVKKKIDGRRMKLNDKFKAHLSQLKAKPNFNLVRFNISWPNTIINHTFIKTMYEWES